MTKKVTSLPSLVVSYKNAQEKIDIQIKDGRELRNESPNYDSEFDAYEQKVIKWADICYEVLGRIFDNMYHADIFNKPTHNSFPIYGYQTKMDELPRLQERIEIEISRLETVKERLKHTPLIKAGSQSNPGNSRSLSTPTKGTGKTLFDFLEDHMLLFKVGLLFFVGLAILFWFAWFSGYLETGYEDENFYFRLTTPSTISPDSTTSD